MPLRIFQCSSLQFSFPTRCWFSNLTYFYASLIAPMGVMLLFNLLVLAVVTRSLHSKLGASPDFTLLNLMRIVVSLSLLVGATWVIGALLSFVDSLVLQYAFAIVNSLQGFMIFCANVLTSRDIRAKISESFNSTFIKSTSASSNSATASTLPSENFESTPLTRTSTRMSVQSFMPSFFSREESVRTHSGGQKRSGTASIRRLKTIDDKRGAKNSMKGKKASTTTLNLSSQSASTFTPADTSYLGQDDRGSQPSHVSFFGSSPVPETADSKTTTFMARP